MRVMAHRVGGQIGPQVQREHVAIDGNRDGAVEVVGEIAGVGGQGERGARGGRGFGVIHGDAVLRREACFDKRPDDREIVDGDRAGQRARSRKVRATDSATATGVPFVSTTKPSCSLGTTFTTVPAPRPNAPE